MGFRETSKGVFYAGKSIINVGRKQIEFLKEGLGNTGTKRTRLCTHRDIDDDLHEMFIVLSRKTYIRPAKHLRKDESLHVVEGRADAIFFDEDGGISSVISLGDYLSGLDCYYRINEPVYHTLVVMSDYFVFHESTKGPFVRSETVFAPWAPDEDDTVAVREYVQYLKAMISDTSFAGRRGHE